MNKIKSLRENKKLTVRSFASKLGISPSVVSKLENGSQKLTGSYIEMFSSFFNVSSDYLLGITDNPLPSNGISSNELQVALYGEIKDLSEEDIEDVLNYARYIKEKRAKKIINLEK